mgnify:CR=1 FL=1|tara:strand:+ start:776 stop:961 length:186 start_codon:yes stop_codon:yes gene_type:complete
MTQEQKTVQAKKVFIAIKAGARTPKEISESTDIPWGDSRMACQRLLWGGRISRRMYRKIYF